MKIVHIVPISPNDQRTGGVENFVKSLLPALETHGLDVCLLGVDKDGSSVEKKPTIYEFEPLLKTNKKSNFTLAYYMNILKKAGKHIGNRDIIHVHRPEPLLFIFLYKNPKVLTIHIFIRENLNLKRKRLVVALYEVYENLLFKYPRLFGVRSIIFVSNHVMEKYLEMFPRIRSISWVIPTAIDINRFKPLLDTERTKIRKQFGYTDEDIILLSIGRLSTEKNIPLLLETFKKVEEKYKNVYLIIGGTGPIERTLRKYATKNCSQRVKFLGRIPDDDIPLYLGMADVFVMSSVIEGASVVVIEALACGCPIVSTNVGSNKEEIQEGKTGFVIDDFNAENLADKVLRVIDKRDEFRRNCIMSKADHSIDTVAKKHIEVYKTVLNAPDILQP